MDSFNIHNYFKRGKTVVLTLRHGDEEIRQWNDKDVAELLKLMKAFHTEFQNPRKKKKEVWDDVANELYKSGYTWSSEDCRKKWSNMIRTFKGIEEQRNDPTYQSKRLKWPFYDALLQLLTLENADAFPEASTVVQLLNSDLTRNTSSASFLRKTTNYRVVENYAKLYHQVVQVGENIQHASTSQYLEPHRDRDDSMNLVSEADFIDMGVSLAGHHDALTGGVQTGGVGGMDSGIIYTQPSRYKTDFMVPASTALPSSTINKASIAVRAKKRPIKRKRGWKDNKVEDSIDSILSKFIETTNQHNEQMLQKITSFHDNTLALMQERNGLLRDIRDGLHGAADEDHNGSLVENCHEALDDTEDQQNTLTLHVGPAFSISTPSELTSSSAAQLNSTLVISTSTAPTASSLSTFQLEDGTVLSSIDGTSDKTVLSNLGTFAHLSDVSLLHPGLVSVVTDTGESSSDMALAMQNTSVITGETEIK